MVRQSHRTRTHGTASTWLRLSALLCLLVFLFGATGQTLHVHTGPATGPGHALQASGNSADLCPLCVSMHSARAAAQQAAPNRGSVMSQQVMAAEGIARSFRWRFCLASRPPPTPETCA
jgi:hypothetical protein